MTDHFVIARFSRCVRSIAAALLFAAAGLARAAVGLDVIPAIDDAGPIALFYPSSTTSEPIKRGPFTLDVAFKGAPVAGNRRLIVISHGSGGSPWPQSDLAHVLVDAGFVVAMPEHRGDNFRDMSDVGPVSWKRRPAEVSHAIDVVHTDPRFGPLLSRSQVGVYGMSAGGLTALTFAGGRWSPAQLARHCEAHITDDFPACVGLTTQLKGDALDAMKIAVAKSVISTRFADATWQGHRDPRVRAVVAAVPMVAVFDLQSLARPAVPVGLVQARKDRWLAPRFHVEAVRRVCDPCTLVADMKQAGHGSLLAPFPPDLSGAAARLLADPPGFDRSSLPAVHQAITDFFLQNLLP